MRWKQTIIITVLANAVLITVLFLSAVTSRENIASNNQAEMSKEIAYTPIYQSNEIANHKIEEKKPVIKEKKDDISKISIKEESKIIKSDENVVYKLPQITKKPKVEEPVRQENYKSVSVKRGDSLERIAKRNSVSLSEVLKINNLSSRSVLQINQQIMLPNKKIAQESKSTKYVKAPVDEKYYIVKCGENPWTIAMKHHMKVEELLKLNKLTKEKARRLRPGDRLKIR
jgi:peptidoglycan DL-endopeptidase LytF